jgi:hypothetical protein
MDDHDLDLKGDLEYLLAYWHILEGSLEELVARKVVRDGLGSLSQDERVVFDQGVVPLLERLSTLQAERDAFNDAVKAVLTTPRAAGTESEDDA